MKTSKTTLALLIGLSASGAHASDAEKDSTDTLFEEILVTGGKENINTLSGSAHLLDEAALEQFDSADLTQVLSTLPGVYVRQEDGYGLRPNIGLRGVSSDRSQKITLMEDGVLIKPAPYSAPSAYYVPNISRMSAVEVVKGPASIKQGPNNVGGAINLATQPVPSASEGYVDAALGEYGFEKYQVFYGNTHDNFGYWVDALHFGSDGFKELDGGGDTGFERTDINSKLQWSFDDLFGYQQRMTLKLGYAEEDADETYLGLTPDDFDDDPNRRYAASQLDKFTSEHSQIHFDHFLQAGDQLSLNTKMYWNTFERSWNKLDGFIGAPYVEASQAGVPVRDILSRSDNVFSRELGILRGEINSRAIPAETLDVTNNDREYGSYGLQFKADYDVSLGDWSHQLEAGIRFHHDYIERQHSTRGYLMVDGTMQNDGIAWGNKTENEAETDAIAVFFHDTVAWGDWTFNAGVRFEDIDASATDFLNETESEKSQSIVVPGVGVHWQFSESLGFLAGVNKGFSPAGATSGEETDAEEATNFEYGLRYQTALINAEVIGFFSDYTNLLGRCRASDTDCNIGEEFNGGSVEVAGVEVYGEILLPLSDTIEFPINVNYTYTESAFQSSFTSSFSQWGDVREGDELPYLPEHVGRIQFGARTTQWEAYLALNYQSEMRDQAGSLNIDDVLHTDAYTTADVSATWNVNAQWMLQLAVDNLTNEEAIVSWRPFGARPNRPRTTRARVKYRF
ncbi:TonB-dependent receptor family protein [Marinibactrum halimedae]|uniref:TonB-dependent receptor n=1 Tax=Marinibactrum halimedae TaxID=1444977 RepID=A0AA37TAZ6_9GAMM|nr:TonB-dependent receptor [Marinibactrum halimedae]MCD9459458.1 TonB-dependent receptor [Marinibactrum halimedae]GLS28112.1 TonB-dependent receptor [Marinibactrum halimedae]